MKSSSTHLFFRQGVQPWLIAALAALPFLAGCARREPAPMAAIRVTTLQVAENSVNDVITAPGAIDAVDKAEVGFLVGGRVISVDAADGSEVQKGGLLARLDPSDYEQTLLIAEAKLAETRARHERLTRLHELGSLTATDYDRIVSALKEAQAAAEIARRQLAYTELRAPFSGKVVHRGIAPGVVAVPAVPLMTVLAPAPVWANISVSEADARRVAVGQTAEITLPAAGRAVYTGRVDAVLPIADSLSRSFTLKVRLPNSDGVLRPGNVATARILTGTSRSAITLPPQAVQKHPDGSLFVWVVDPQRKTASRRVVEAGPLRATEVEIRSGLRSGELVVRDVPLTLFDGTPVSFALSP